MTKQNKKLYDPFPDVFQIIGKISDDYPNDYAWKDATGILGYFRGPANGNPENPVIEILNEGSYKFVPYYFEIQDPVSVAGATKPSTLFVILGVQTQYPFRVELRREFGDDDLTKLPEGVYTLITGYPRENRRL